MKVLFLLSDYVLHNSILSDYAADRPHDELAVVKIPLVLKGKGRRETAGRIVPQLSKRFVAGKITEFLSLALVTSLPKLLGRGAEFQRLRKLSRRLGCPFHRTENIMHSETLEFVREFAPDVIVSLCHQILREPLISMAPLGIVNVHPGLLPDYRGIQPYFWELSEGALEAGATLHLIEDERIDTGGILGRSSFAIQEGMSVQLNYYLTIRCASNVLARCLSALQNGELEAERQVAEEGAYYRWPDSAAFDRLRRRGHPLLSLVDLVGILVGRFDDFTPERSELTLTSGSE